MTSLDRTDKANGKSEYDHPDNNWHKMVAQVKIVTQSNANHALWRKNPDIYVILRKLRRYFLRNTWFVLRFSLGRRDTDTH